MAMGMTGLLRWHWVEKIPWSRKWQPAPVFFPEKFHGEGSLEGYIHGDTKGQTQLSNWTRTWEWLSKGVENKFTGVEEKEVRGQGTGWTIFAYIEIAHN